MRAILYPELAEAGVRLFRDEGACWLLVTYGTRH